MLAFISAFVLHKIKINKKQDMEHYFTKHPKMDVFLCLIKKLEEKLRFINCSVKWR